jgi:nicotinamidase-related amidase
MTAEDAALAGASVLDLEDGVSEWDDPDDADDVDGDDW